MANKYKNTSIDISMLADVW